MSHLRDFGREVVTFHFFDPFAKREADETGQGHRSADVLRRVVADAPGFLRPGGAVLLELGGDQADVLRATLDHLGYASVRTWSDEDGDLRGLEATYG